MVHLALDVADLILLLLEAADDVSVIVYLFAVLGVDLFDQMQEEFAFLVELGVLFSHTSVVDCVHFGQFVL